MCINRKTQAKLQIIMMMFGLIGMPFVIVLWGNLVVESMSPNFDFWAVASFFVSGVVMVVPVGLMIFVLQTALREFWSGVWSLFLDSVSLTVWGLANWLFSWFMWRLVTNVPGIDATVVVTLQGTFALVTLLPIVLFILHDIAEIRNKPSKLSQLLN